MKLKLGFEAGIVSREELEQWADSILLSYDYDDDVAALSVNQHITDKDAWTQLSRIAAGADPLQAVRHVMAQLHDDLERKPSRANAITRFLEGFWIDRGFEVPEDMLFIAGIADEFSLAEEGICGTVEEATKSLLDNLNKFK